jgi:hypothetical protein
VALLNFAYMRPLAGVVALALLGGTLTGCAAGPGGGINSGSELAAVPGDPCGQQRYDFGRSQTYFSDQIATGAITGGVIGAGTGAMIGGLAGGWRGAGIGALAGLAAGAVAGGVNSYYGTMAERYQDQVTLAQAINSDLTREAQETERVTATFARLRECRLAQAQSIRQQVRAGQMPRPVARQQLIFERDRFQEELALADRYQVAMQKRDQEFQSAAQSLNQPPAETSSSVPRQRTAAAQAPTRQAVVAATETVPEKRNAFAASVASARTQTQAAFNVDDMAAS